VVSSYTPTLTALIQARDGLPAISRDSLSALVVAEASAPGLARIPHASEEAATVADVFGSSLPTARLVVHGLDIDTGSRVSMVLDALTEAHIVHLACHGQQHLTKPLDSRFCLRDGPLTVSMLMQLKLPRALFAFLSACETAQGDRTQPDQAIHLAAAMLFTGFRSIVATMW
jgi:CHAT domain-containing protein